MAVISELAAQAPARRLEHVLGDPFNPEAAVSFRRLIEHDEREEPPLDAFELLRTNGVHAQLVPQGLGGRLTSFEELLALVRVVSRRDLVLTTGLGSTMLAAIPVWAWGSDAQRATVANLLLDAGAFGCFAVSERDAGSDLLATATRADVVDGGYRLFGEKWLVGNATRCSFVVALVRTEVGLSLLFLRPDETPTVALRRLPKIRTLGLRGHDMGGMVFDGCMVPSGALVGRSGRGVEMALTTLQYTRTMIGGMALGAADTALRLAVGWGRDRRLYGEPILAIPAVRSLLLGSFLDLLIAECVTTVTARALTMAPRRTSLWAAITKYLVPNLCERVVRDASVVLSARSYLREGIAHGMFQKILRDIAITSIFEGTQLVQLSLIAAQLGQLFRLGRRDVDRVDLELLGNLEIPAPSWNFSSTALRVGDPGGDELVERWFGPESPPSMLEAGPRAAATVRSLRQRAIRLRDALANVAATDHAVARQHSILHAAACCLQIWHSSVHVLTRGAADGEWLALCLERLADSDWAPAGADLEGPVFAWMLDQVGRNELFSILRFEVAK